jgi:GR25 family glycosyltransferase involved in LPS biosynthesis
LRAGDSHRRNRAMECIYINLDSAVERKLKFETNFNAFKKPDWTLTRFSAVNTEMVKARNVKGESQPAEKGCFLSHRDIIGANLDHDRPLFILEDDAVIGKRTCALVERAFSQNDKPDWDILFTDVCIPGVKAMVDTLRFRRELAAKKVDIAFMNLTKTNFAGSTAYLVNPQSKRKLYSLLCAADELNIPYDLYLRGLAHISALKVYVIFPFVTSLSALSETSQIKSAVDRTQLAWNMFRKMVWMERNLAECKPVLEQLKSTLAEKDLVEFNSLLTSPDQELKAFGILFSAAAAKAA